MAQPRDESGALWWVKRWWRALVAELVATMLLVGLGCASAVPVGGPGSVTLTHPALAFGFLVAALVNAFGDASGAHMNPAVTLAMLIRGRITALPALAYVVVQCVGAVIGFSGLAVLMPAGMVQYPVGDTVLAKGMSPLEGVIIEAVLTALLVMTAFSLSETDPTAPIKLGFVVAGLIYAAGAATGASLNPARSLGPAVQYGNWRHLWVFWVGPLAGATIGALLQRWVLLVRPEPEPRAPLADCEADLPLNDKA